MAFGHSIGIFPLARRDGDRIKSCFPIRDEVAVVDDEPAAEDADAEIFSAGERWVNIELHGANGLLEPTQQINPPLSQAGSLGQIQVLAASSSENSSSHGTW